MEKSFTNVVQESEKRFQAIEEFRKKPVSAKTQMFVFIMLSVVATLAASLLFLQIITGALALIVAGITTVALIWGFKAIKTLSPVAQQKAKNMKLSMMIKEARKNATAQLQNQVLERHKRLQVAKDARDKMGALVKNLKSKIDSANPESTAYSKMKAIHASVEKAYATVLVNIDNAARSNTEFERKVQEYVEMDAFTDMANEAMAVFDYTNDHKLQDMLSLEAFRNIDMEFDTAITSIENSARDIESVNL